MEIKANHEGTEIVYMETENEWEFVLRGRTRRAACMGGAA